MLKATARLTTLGTLRNPVAQGVRNLLGHLLLGLTAVQHAIADNITEVSLGYPHSALNGSGLEGGPAPGHRVVPAADQTPVGSGATARFALFAERTSAVADLLRRFDGLLDPAIRPPLRQGALWLVRPDGYVAGAAEDAAVIADYLERLQPTLVPDRAR